MQSEMRRNEHIRIDCWVAAADIAAGRSDFAEVGTGTDMKNMLVVVAVADILLLAGGRPTAGHMAAAVPVATAVVDTPAAAVTRSVVEESAADCVELTSPADMAHAAWGHQGSLPGPLLALLAPTGRIYSYPRRRVSLGFGR